VNDAVIRKVRIERRAGRGRSCSFLWSKPGRLNVFLLKPFENKPTGWSSMSPGRTWRRRKESSGKSPGN